MREGNPASSERRRSSFSAATCAEASPVWICTRAFIGSPSISQGDWFAVQRGHSPSSFEIEKDIRRAFFRVGLKPVPNRVVVHRQIPENGLALRFQPQKELLEYAFIH